MPKMGSFADCATTASTRVVLGQTGNERAPARVCFKTLEGKAGQVTSPSSTKDRKSMKGAGEGDLWG